MHDQCWQPLFPCVLVAGPVCVQLRLVAHPFALRQTLDGTLCPAVVCCRYDECRGRVLRAAYPCRLKDALAFGALQLHVQCGAYDPKLHKPGFVDELKTLVRQLVPAVTCLPACQRRWSSCGLLPIVPPACLPICRPVRMPICPPQILCAWPCLPPRG